MSGSCTDCVHTQTKKGTDSKFCGWYGPKLPIGASMETPKLEQIEYNQWVAVSADGARQIVRDCPTWEKRKPTLEEAARELIRINDQIGPASLASLRAIKDLHEALGDPKPEPGKPTREQMEAELRAAGWVTGKCALTGDAMWKSVDFTSDWTRGLEPAYAAMKAIATPAKSTCHACGGNGYPDLNRSCSACGAYPTRAGVMRYELLRSGWIESRKGMFMKNGDSTEYLLYDAYYKMGLK